MHSTGSIARNDHLKRAMICLLVISLAIIAFIGGEALEPEPLLVMNGFRLGYFYMAYPQFGFIKRGLLGTLAYPLMATEGDLGASALYIGCAAIILACITIGGLRLLELNCSSMAWLLIFCAASPSNFWNAGYDFGRMDLFLMLILILASCRIRANDGLSTFILGAAGILIHEAFLLWGLPILVALMCVESQQQSRWPQIALICFGWATVIAALLIFARPVPAHEVQVFIDRHVNDFDAKIWERSGTDNLHVMLDYLKRPYVVRNWIESACVFAGILALLISFVDWKRNRWLLGVLTAANSGLLLHFIACDFQRWQALAAQVAFLGVFYLLLTGRAQLKVGITLIQKLAVLAFFFMGPLGFISALPLPKMLLASLKQWLER